MPFACAYHPDIAGFNSIFAQHGLPQANARHYGWGLELRSLLGTNFLVGPMFFRTWDDVDNERFKLRTDATGVFGEIGLRLPVFNFLTIVPMVGLGGVQPKFQILKKTGDLPVDSLLTDPGKSSTITPGMKLTGIALMEIDLLVPTDAGRYGIGLRGGYLYSPFPLEWRLSNGALITDTPNSRLRGPWFSIGITLVPAPEVTTE